MKDNITKITILTIILLTILGVIGFSYAYFNTDVNGEGKYITLNTAELKLRYTDDVTMSLTNAIPGDKIERVFTVENIGTKTVSYNIVWKDLINTINNYDLHLDMKCKSYKNYGKSNQEEYGTCDSFYKAVPTTETSISKDIKRDIEIEVGVTQVYNVTITFLNRPYDQSENLNKSFNGKIDLEEYIDPSPEPIYCTYDGELVQGAEYVNGQYTYRYMQQRSSLINLEWSDKSFDGWGVSLSDINSTEPATSKICTYINNKPVVSTSHMFSNSKANSIDLTSFNTSNVKDMGNMFNGVEATEIKGLETFNTNNVTDMNQMFKASKVIILNLDNFNTKNVTDMTGMFYYSNFSEIKLNNFDTSNVTDMNNMFTHSKATIIDVSSFDTSKVTNMNNMFYGSELLKTIYVSNKFNVNKVTTSDYMFEGCINLVGGKGTKYNSSYIDKTYARIDGGTSSPGYFTAR